MARHAPSREPLWSQGEPNGTIPAKSGFTLLSSPNPPPFLATFGTQKRHYDPQLTTTSTTTSRTPFLEVRTLTSHRRTTFKGGRWLWLSVLCQNLSVSHSHVSLSLSLTFYLFVSMSLSLSLTLFLFVSMSPSLYLKHSICLFSLHFHLFNTAW